MAQKKIAGRPLRLILGLGVTKIEVALASIKLNS